MTTTVLGLFDRCSEAQRVIHTFLAQGIRSEDIHLVANREETSVSDALAVGMWGVNVDVGPASRGEPAAFIALGIPADQTQEYAMVLDGGGTLVSVVAADDQVDQALELLGRSATEDLEAQAVPSSTLTQARRGVPGGVLATRLMALALLTVAPVVTGHARGMAKATRTGTLKGPVQEIRRATVEISRLSSWLSTREGAPRAPGSPGRLLLCVWPGHLSALLLARW